MINYFFNLHELLHPSFLILIQTYHFRRCLRIWHFQLEDMATSRSLHFTISSESIDISTSCQLSFTISRFYYPLTPQTDRDHKSSNREKKTRTRRFQKTYKYLWSSLLIIAEDILFESNFRANVSACTTSNDRWNSAHAIESKISMRLIWRNQRFEWITKVLDMEDQPSFIANETEKQCVASILRSHDNCDIKSTQGCWTLHKNGNFMLPRPTNISIDHLRLTLIINVRGLYVCLWPSSKPFVQQYSGRSWNALCERPTLVVG